MVNQLEGCTFGSASLDVTLADGSVTECTQSITVTVRYVEDMERWEEQQHTFYVVLELH